LTVYVVDTSSLIDLVWRRYGQDVFPSLHELIDRLIDADRLVSHDEVFKEVERIDDGVFAWCKARRGIFGGLEPEVMLNMRRVLENTPHVVDATRRQRNAADPWLVAQALHVNGVVVTEERASPGAASAKLPDVCRVERVGCIGLFDLMKREGWSF